MSTIPIGDNARTLWWADTQPSTITNKLSIMSRLNKLVASNTLNANRALMESVKETNRVLWYRLKSECDRIIKRYPSLA